MYCAHCGKELAEGANFCTACGSQASVAERLAIAEEMAPEEMGGVSAALSSGRARSRLRMSPMILLVLALALTAGIAAAAIYVYNEIYLPSIAASNGTAGYIENESVSPAPHVYSFSYESVIEDDELARFVYPVITSSQHNAVVDSLNDRLRDEVRTAATQSIYSGPGTEYYALRYLATYCDNGVVSLWRIESRGFGHVDSATSCETIELETGELLSPEKVMGVDKEAMYQDTVRAVSGLSNNRMGELSNSALESMRADVDDSTYNFFLVPGGLAYSFHSHAYGTTHGICSVVVESDGSTFAVGDVIGGYYPNNTEKLPGIDNGAILTE